jgi:hypothetical protein
VINPSQLLANDYDVENQDISILHRYLDIGGNESLVTVDNAWGGTVALENNGVITFLKDPNFLGIASFDYAVGPVPIGVEMKKAYPLGEQKPGG